MMCAAVLLAAWTASCSQPGIPAAQKPTRPEGRTESDIKTGIGLLLDHRAELQLTTEQCAALEELARELDSLNWPLQVKLGDLPPGRERPVRESKGGGPGARSGAKGIGGARSPGAAGGGGRMAGGGPGRRGGGRATPARQPPAVDPSENENRDTEVAQLQSRLAENHASVLRKAFDLLAPKQVEQARRLLDDEGYEPPPVTPADAGEPRPR